MKIIDPSAGPGTTLSRRLELEFTTEDRRMLAAGARVEVDLSYLPDVGAQVVPPLCLRDGKRMTLVEVTDAMLRRMSAYRCEACGALRT